MKFKFAQGVTYPITAKIEEIPVLKRKKKPKKKKPVRDDWTCGYACACAIAAKIGGHLEGQDLMREGGFSRESFEEADVEECDIQTLFPET